MRGMRALLSSAMLILLAGCAGTDRQGYASASMTDPGYGDPVSSFYDELSPYGRWISVPFYGRCWTPVGMDAGWRPYTNGYWGWSDYGWTWASYEPWGWATYHYGRWFLDPVYGWTWVPDATWGPAWVAWRSGDDWAGWAPLPPSATWSASAGLGGGSSLVARIPASQWNFVGSSSLLDRNLASRIAPVSGNGALLAQTANVTSFGVRGGKAVNRSLAFAAVQRATSVTPPRVAVTPVVPRPPVTRVPGASPEVQRQQADDRKHLEAFLRGERARLHDAQSAEYRAARDRAERDALRERHQAESQAFEQQAERQRQALARGGRPVYQPFDRTAAGGNDRGARGRGDGGG